MQSVANISCMKKLLLLLLICIPFSGSTQKTDKKLEAALKEKINGFNGNIGIYVKNLRTGKTAMINADTLFPTGTDGV